MFIPEELIEKVRENNDIVDVISEHVSLKRKGKSYIGLCPFHKEKTPSFNVQQDKQMYHCFGCGEGGNVISFLMKYRNLEFIEAVKILAEKANIEISENNRANSVEMSLKAEIYQINREAAKYFYSRLRNSSNALNYFKKRGISLEIIKKFGLGYSLDSWDSIYKFLLSRGYRGEIIEKSGLIVRKKDSGYYDRFRNRVMFPVIDIRGRIIGFGGRVLDDSVPKYLNSPETLVFNKGNNLYGLNLVLKNNTQKKIIIVEGYMDVIALHQYGISNAVASLGTALTREQGKLLRRYSDDIIICYDSDTAGQAATLRGLDILSDAGCEVKVLDIPKGKDPDEFIRSEGKEAFISSMNDTMPLVEYKIKRKTEGFDISTTEGKIGFIKSCAKVLGDLNDSITLDAYISNLSNKTGISEAALYEEVARQKKSLTKGENSDNKHITGNSRYNNNIDGQKLYLEPALIKAEKFVLHIIYEMREYFNVIEKKLDCEDFNDTTLRRVACIMYEKLKNNEQINPASIIDCFLNNEDMKKVTEIFNVEPMFDSNSLDKVIDDNIKLITKTKLINKKSLLLSQMQDFEENGDVIQSTQVLKNVMEIEKQLKVY